jgi:diguanylate cyclase (GGDEF)-like protein/putative nucleotidyltransferase with HDIG domain
MISYIIIPIIAVLSYTFLLLAFLAAKKNSIINSFIGVLISSIAWTGGSLLMRTHFLNLDKLWYDLSIFGLIILAYELLIFVKSFAGLKKNILDKALLFLCLITIAINTLTGFFLKIPNLVINAAGEELFVYDITQSVIFLFILLTLMIIYILKVTINNFKEEELKESAIKPVKIGLVVLFLGHLFTIFPLFEGFPIDILSGIFFVITLFYSMYKKKLFKLDLLISKGVVYALSGAITILILTNTVGMIENYLDNCSYLIENKVMFISVIFTLLAFLIYRLMEMFVDKIYISDETARNEVLRNFKNSAFSSLEVAEISKMIINLVRSTMDVKEVYVLLPQKDNKFYRVTNTSNPLNKVNFKLEFENPLLKLLSKDGECLLTEDLKKLNAFKSLWIEEKKQLMYLGVECFVPLIDDEELIGVLMISEKHRGYKYNYEDILFLEGMSMISSAALRKAQLYEKVYNEARRDDLTNLLNRKYFLAGLEDLYKRKNDDLLSIAIFDIDDFKLYNQLYGNSSGDKILVDIAKIVEATMEGIGICARYDSKVFACVFPTFDLNQTKSIAEKIVKQINEINSKSSEYKLKKIGVSCGISTIPFLANNTKELINDAELAVYYVKRNGKNSIRISTGQIVKRNENLEQIVHKSGIFSEYTATINALTATINTKDHYTYSHSNNVAYYATELANSLNMDEDSVEIIRESALLHDIGKIGIEENILNKNGKLTDKERIVMQSHVENSVSIIKHLPSLTYLIPAVIGHHERWDGNGYPRRIMGTDIPLFARILCISDSFDAMISKRPYKETRSVDFALKEISKGSGTQFDPDLTTIFVDLIKSNKIVPIIDN